MDMDRRGRHVGMAGQVLHRPEAWSDSSSAVAKEWRSVCGVDGRTACGKGYAMSLRRRKMIEEAFGWIKTVGGLRKTRHKGLEKLSGQALFAFAAYNLTRMLSLMRPAAA
jgi:IS5 family transposase